MRLYSQGERHEETDQCRHAYSARHRLYCDLGRDQDRYACGVRDDVKFVRGLREEIIDQYQRCKQSGCQPRESRGRGDLRRRQDHARGVDKGDGERRLSLDAETIGRDSEQDNNPAGARVGVDLSSMRVRQGRNDADRRLSVLLRVRQLPGTVAAQSRRLLRLLLVRLDQVPAHSSATVLLHVASRAAAARRASIRFHLEHEVWQNHTISWLSGRGRPLR